MFEFADVPPALLALANAFIGAVSRTCCSPTPSPTRATHSTSNGWPTTGPRCWEAVVVDGLATRVQRPAGWANQKVLYNAKRHAHTAQGVAASIIWGDLLWCDHAPPLPPRSAIR
jgi:hypothetical protein